MAMRKTLRFQDDTKYKPVNISFMSDEAYEDTV